MTRTAAGTRVAPGAARALVEASDVAGVAIDDVLAIVRAIANRQG